MSNRKHPLFLGSVILATVLKLVLAWTYFGNYDQESWEIVQRAVLSGKTVYCETSRYTTSPVWFHILGALGRVSEFTGLSSHFVIRSWLTFIDLVTAWFVYRVAGLLGGQCAFSAFCFLVNPMGILLTGYHGQFENVALLPVLAGLYVQLSSRVLGWQRKLSAWALVTAGAVTKHIVIFAPLFTLSPSMPSAPLRLVSLAATVVVFLASFIPYWSECGEHIIRNVFEYTSVPRPYGFVFLLPALAQPAVMKLYKVAFALLLTVVGLISARWDLVKACLIWMLSFLVFTPGMGNQYFTLPLLFGSLRPSTGYYAFSAMGTAFLVAHPDNVGGVWFPQLAGLFGSAWNVMWVASLAWLISELLDRSSQSTLLPAHGPRG